jgi:hypothetical protein
MTTPGLEIDFTAKLAASIQTLAEGLQRDREFKRRQLQAVRQIPFATSIAIGGGTNGAVDQPDQMQAKTGFIWGVRRLAVQGFSAGTVTAYRNGVVSAVTGLNPGEPVLPYPVPAVNTLGKGQLLLMPGDRLNFGAVGVTLSAGFGQVQIWGVADCLEEWYLPYYLG